MAGQEPTHRFSSRSTCCARQKRLGFETTLIAERFLGPDLEAWVMAGAIARETSTIEIMPAVHPGIVTPQVVAKMAATLDRISGGRCAINLVNGWWKDEFNLFGNGTWLEREDARYRRMDEFLQVMKGLWTQDTFSLQGEFYHVEAGSLPTEAGPAAASAALYRQPFARGEGYRSAALRCDVRSGAAGTS